MNEEAATNKTVTTTETKEKSSWKGGWFSVFKSEMRMRTYSLRGLGRFRYIGPLWFIIVLPFLWYGMRDPDVGITSELDPVFEIVSGYQIATIVIVSLFAFAYGFPSNRAWVFSNQSEAELVLGSKITPRSHMFGRFMSDLYEIVTMIGFVFVFGSVFSEDFSLIDGVMLVFALSAITFSGLWLGELLIPRIWPFLSAGSTPYTRGFLREKTHLFALLLIPLTFVAAVILPEDLFEILVSFTPFGWASRVAHYAITHKKGKIPLGLAFNLLILFTLVAMVYGAIRAEKAYTIKETDIQKIKAKKPFTVNLVNAIMKEGSFSRVSRTLFTEASRRNAGSQFGVFLIIGLLLQIIILYLSGEIPDFEEFLQEELIISLGVLIVLFTFFEVLASFSGQIGESLWIIRGAPEGVKMVFKAKWLQTSLQNTPYIIIIALIFSIIIERSITVFIVLLAIGIGFILIGTAMSILAFAIRPIMDVSELFANPFAMIPQIFIITIGGMIIAEINIGIIYLLHPITLAALTILIINFLLSYPTIKIAAKILDNKSE